MPAPPVMAREKLLELLHLIPEAPMREGYVMALQNAVDDYVRAILHDFDAADETRSCRSELASLEGR